VRSEEVPIMVSPGRTTQTISREQLVRALDRLQADGRWSREHAAALLAELDRATPEPDPRAPAPLGNRLAEAAAYAGAVLIGAAGAVLVGQQWEDLGRSGRVAVLAAVTLVLAGVGIAVAAVRPRGRAALLQPAQAVRRRLASTALTIAAATGAGTVGVLSSGHELLFVAVTSVLVMTVAQAVAPSAVSETAGLAAVALLAGAILDEAHASFAAVVVVLAVLGVAWAALTWTRLLTVPTLGLALGLGLTLYSGVAGAFYGTQPEEGLGIAVLGLLAVGGLAGYVRTGRWPLAAAGVLALASLVFRVTTDSLGAPVALLLTGLVLLGAGAVLLIRRRSAEPR
jgi:hypothetical protein